MLQYVSNQPVLDAKQSLWVALLWEILQASLQQLEFQNKQKTHKSINNSELQESENRGREAGYP